MCVATVVGEGERLALLVGQPPQRVADLTRDDGAQRGLVRAGTRGHLAEKDRLWSELRAQDPWLYRKVRWSVLGQLSNLPGPAGRRVSVLAYRVAQRTIGFS